MVETAIHVLLFILTMSSIAALVLALSNYRHHSRQKEALRNPFQGSMSLVNQLKPLNVVC